MIRVIKPYLFLLPAGIILLLFHLIPFLGVIWISLFRDWGTDSASFTGAANYQAILQREEFFRSLGITLWYAVGTIPITIVLSLILAVILRRNMWGGTFYRVIYFLPYITSTVAAAAVWRWIFHVEQRGLANAILGQFGGGPLRFTEESRGIFELILGHGLPLLGAGPSLALVSVMIFAIWQTFGFYVIIFYAGLSQIPKEVYEAASLDGAGIVRSFVSLTVPLMRPILGFLLLVSTISAFQTFNQIYIMSPSERQNTTKNTTMYIFSEFWDSGRLGHAAAAAVVLFIILASLSLIQTISFRKRD